jgi:hypothetical protein
VQRRVLAVMSELAGERIEKVRDLLPLIRSTMVA